MSFLGVVPLLISLFDTEHHMSSTNQKTCDPYDDNHHGVAHYRWKTIHIEQIV